MGEAQQGHRGSGRATEWELREVERPNRLFVGLLQQRVCEVILKFCI